MRLTNYIRDSFVANALNDVPSIDYCEQTRDRINVLAKAARKAAKLPESEIARYDDNYLHMGRNSMYVAGLLKSEIEQIQKDTILLELNAKDAEQTAARDALCNKLAAVANSVTTRKALVELLPEFEKYLPAEEAKASNLPAISNMMGDFIRAGWPKAKQGAVKAATP